MFGFFTSSHRLTSETIEYLEAFLRIPRNKTTFSSCRLYILYYCTVAATSAATKMPYTTVYLHMHAVCSRKLNTFNNQIIDLSKSFGNIHLPATRT